MGYENAKVTSVGPQARSAGLMVGDTLEALNGVPFRGRAQLQAARWYARATDTLRVSVRKSSGVQVDLAIPLQHIPQTFSLAESIFVVFVQMVIPFSCLFIGYWVAIARPWDPIAWFILIILSVPEEFISISTFNWLPGIWLVPRLYWHLTLSIMAPVAMLWLGLLFLERSRVDLRVPWLKWLVLGVQFCGLWVELAADYSSWYDLSFLPSRRVVEPLADKAIGWNALLCLALYWVSIFEKLITASTADARRRMRVLCGGSVIGLGSVLIIWGLLPRFGINPASMEWLGYLSAFLLLFFPASVAYVVIVQRAMDVRILVRMGTRYAAARTSLVLLQIAAAAFLILQFILPALRHKPQEAVSWIVPLLAAAVLARLFVFRRGGATSRLQQWLDRKYFREAYNAELILSDLADRARSITHPAALIETVSSRISEVLHVPQIAVLLRNVQVFQLGYAVGDAAAGIFDFPETSPPVQHLIRTNAPAVLYRNDPDQWFREARTEQQDALNQIQAELLLPLAGRSQLWGIIILGPKQSEEPYSPSDLRLLASVGAQTGLGLEISALAQSLASEAEQHQRIQREVEIAHEVQERLFPQQFPATSGTELAGHCRPALGVGGDYYDVFELDDGRLALAVGDVSGKGIPAALLMASLRASLRGLVESNIEDLAQLMRKLNRLVYDSSAINRYATFFFAIYDPVARELRFVNAGHNPVFILRNDADMLRLEEGGPVIGLLKAANFTESRVALGCGDLLFAYTDGISEAMTVDEEEWGEDRMLAAAQRARTLSAESILSAVFDAADAFTAGAAQHDDMTVLLMKLV